MSFNNYEQSSAQGRPVELLEIRYGNDPSDIARLTSHDHDLTVAGETYLSETIERDAFSDKGDPDDSEQMNIKLPQKNLFADIYRTRDFVTAVGIKLRALHLSDPDQQVTALWSGRLVGVNWEQSWMVLGAERMSTSLRRAGLTARYEVGRCRHVHYQPGCWLTRGDWAVPGIVSVITNGRHITVAEAASSPDGWFTGGILEHNGVMRWIIQHTGAQLVLSGPLQEMIVASPVTLYPGCDRTRATCAAKFGNVGNYGGFDFLNPDGPMTGNSIV